jgi:hypothetical protein
MDVVVGGRLPSPRVAVLGTLEKDELAGLEDMFPTVWQGSGLRVLASQVAPQEVDLLVVGSSVSSVGKWADTAHVICFSSDSRCKLPGPVQGTRLCIASQANTREYELPHLSLPLGRLRKETISCVDGIRFWPTLRLCGRSGIFAREGSLLAGEGIAEFERRLEKESQRNESAQELLRAGSLILERATGSVLAVALLRTESRLGVAWLPHKTFCKQAWVRTLAEQWSKHDPVGLPGLGEWRSCPKWMTREEDSIRRAIDSLAAERTSAIADYEMRIQKLQDELDAATASADRGRRRLITSQGQALVDEVAAAFRVMGFHVQDMDTALAPGQVRREDLRLTDSEGKCDWECIVEVHSHAKSSGKTSDLGRLNRFAELYAAEKGHLPSKRFYVVNGETDLFPDQRTRPFLGAVEDVAVFAECNGLIIWTVDLFQALQDASEAQIETLRASLKESTGIWNGRAPQE